MWLTYLYRGEHVRNVISCPVHFSKDNVLIVLQHFLCNFFVNGIKLFTVSAPVEKIQSVTTTICDVWMFLPRSVEENDPVLLCLMNLIVVVVSDHFLHHPLVFLGHRQRLHVGLDLAVAKILYEGGKVGSLKVVHGLHPELQLQLLLALMKSRFMRKTWPSGAVLDLAGRYTVVPREMLKSKALTDIHCDGIISA